MVGEWGKRNLAKHLQQKGGTMKEVVEVEKDGEQFQFENKYDNQTTCFHPRSLCQRPVDIGLLQNLFAIFQFQFSLLNLFILKRILKYLVMIHSPICRQSLALMIFKYTTRTLFSMTKWLCRKKMHHAFTGTFIFRHKSVCNAFWALSTSHTFLLLHNSIPLSQS